MIRIGLPPRLRDFANEVSAVVDQWLTQVTERFNLQQKSGAPVVAEVPENQWGIFKDTSGGDVALYVNDSGTLKYVVINTTGGGGSTLVGPTTASGTAVDFTSIPTVTEVEVSWVDLSTNGTSNIIVQIGDSGGVETSGYTGSVWSAGGAAGVTYTTGFLVTQTTAAATLWSGSIKLTLHDPTNNIWVVRGINSPQSTNVHFYAGDKALSGTLTQIRVTTAGGVNTFDNGTISVRYK